MKRLLFNIILLLLIQNSFGHEITIKGYVLDSSTSAPLIYSNITVKGLPIGVSTNEMGEFSFHIPIKNRNDTLSISAIGYKSYECIISNITRNDSLVVLLKEQNYELDNVIKIPDEELQEIIQNVTENIKRNYPRRKYLLSGFYRELVLKDNEYTRLIEAAIDFQKKGINNPSDDMIRIRELRKSNSFVEYDWKSKLFKKIHGERNQLYNLISKDIINYHDQTFTTKNILTKEFVGNYDFILDDIIFEDSVKIYKIRFFDKKYYDDYEGNFSSIGNHWIYVREGNFAVTKYEFKHQIVKMSEKYKIVNFQNNCIRSHSVSYKEYQGKYYPYLFEVTSVIMAKGADEYTGKGKQYMKASLLINNILTRRSDYERIKERFLSPINVDLYNQEYEYNREFWESYNMIRLNPMYSQVRSDLEEEVTLEEQFVKNGK